jgi:hypothetical protein
MASGNATTRATVAMRIVPTSTAAMPKLPASGCQAAVVRKEKPATSSAWLAR